MIIRETGRKGQRWPLSTSGWVSGAFWDSAGWGIK
jgi:hypothetical protein